MRKTLTLLQPPAVLPLTLEETKAHLLVDHDEQDRNIKRYISAATRNLDGRDGWLNRCLIAQQWELRLDHFPGLMPGGMLSLRDDGYPSRIEIPLPPLRSIDAVYYIDSDGNQQTLDPSVYQVVNGGFGKAQLALAYGQVWPATLWQPDAVRIQFTAGYATQNGLEPGDPNAVPDAILQGLLLLVGDLFANRDAQVITAGRLTIGVNTTLDALLSPYKVGGVG